jgi:hypothetical protein
MSVATNTDHQYDNYSLVLNSTHIVPNTGNSVFQYKFVSSVTFKDATISLGSIQLYYSWFNISQALNNNRFSYKWFDNSGILNSVFEIKFPDGYYSVNDLNEYIQSILVSRGHYLVQVSSGNHIYHIEFTTNSVYYAVQLNCYAMRTTSADFTRGSTDWAYPSEATTVQVIISSASQFNLLVGLNVGVYPEASDTNNHTFLSNITPNMNPVSNLLMSCSLANQGGFSDPSNIIYTFSSGNAEFGGMIDRSPSLSNHIRIADGQYSSFTVNLIDQNYQRVDIKDPNSVIILHFRIRKPT